jgi:uncharacterized protein
VDSRLFEEEGIKISGDRVEVGASFTIPKTNPTTGVGFLGGSGPMNRESTLGPNTPLKDLAWRLASNGIAVAR